MKSSLFKTKSEAKAWKQSEEDYGLTCVIKDYNDKYLVECGKHSRKQQKDTSYWTRRAALALEEISRKMDEYDKTD